MVIAVNTTVLVNDTLNYKSNFVQEVFKRIAQQNPQHQFIFIFDTSYNDEFIFSKNITPILIKNTSQNKLALKYWYDIKLPIALKKYKPDLLIQANGVCSSTISTPQFLILNDNISSKKNTAKAKQIIVSSQFLKNEIIKKFKADANAINVVYGAAQASFKQLSFEEMMQVKDGYADGREYFLLVEDENLMNILKAFSMFKKWQRSNMKLLVIASVIKQNKKIIEQLETYKYRDDVLLLDNIDEHKLKKLTASAYCVLYPSFNICFPVRVIEAMLTGVPVITNNIANISETITTAALYANTNAPQEIADQMQLIYKDEILRSKLIKDGLQQATQFSWDNAANMVWAIVEKILVSS